MARESPGTRLLRAQERALDDAQRIDRLELDALNRLAPDLDVASAITAAEATFVNEGASSLELDLDDPDLAIEASGVIGPSDRGRLRNVRVSLDGIGFRLAAMRRNGPQLHLTFEDAAVQMLRGPKAPLTASRGSMTRAQFVEKLVRDVPGNRRLILVPFWSPEKSVRQAIAAPELPSRRQDATPVAGEGGFDSGAKLLIKGIPADAEQKRQLTVALQVADEEEAPERARLAEVVSGIGESSFRVIPNAAGSGYAGVFQADPRNIPMKDTEQQARSFLRGGKGFQAGGAINAARDHPDWSPGTIATRVEASGQPGSFYDEYRGEAEAILSAWSQGAGHSTGSDPVLQHKSFQFTRGLPDKRESSFEAGIRIADEVHWRFFVAAGIAVFVSDDRLMMNPASLVIERGDDALLDQTWAVDHGKLADSVELRVLANRWSLLPGAVIALRDMGLATGRWLVERVEHDLLTDIATVQLYKPHATLKEPAHEVDENDDPNTSNSSPSSSNKSGQPKELATGLTYPLSAHGTKGGGPEEHAQRAWGNWQSDNAVDILVAQGTDVLAVDDGEIVKLGGAWRGGQGNPDGYNVTLKTGDNEWFYTHLRHRSDRVRVGMRVKAGDFLGGSGAANGVNHLHIGCKTGNPVVLLGLDGRSPGGQLPTNVSKHRSGSTPGH